jgi:hypothetical protein
MSNLFELEIVYPPAQRLDASSLERTLKRGLRFASAQATLQRSLLLNPRHRGLVGKGSGNGKIPWHCALHHVLVSMS